MKIWVDIDRFVPLMQEMFAKSGQLLKWITLTNVTQIQGRWFPVNMVDKDVLKKGK